MVTETTSKRNLKPLWIVLAFVTLITIIPIPNNSDLPVVWQRALAILAFAVILWVTYPVSSAMILAATAILLGLTPSMADPSVDMGTKEALKMTLGGLSSSSVALVGAALF